MSTCPTDLEIRPVQPGDEATLLGLIRKLAEYEQLLDSVTATEQDFREALFGPRPSAEALLGFSNGRPVAYAIYFFNFSTFLGRPGLYIEDLFVEQDLRGRGFGKSLFLRLVGIAKERGCGRMEWAALTWNEPAIRFYRGLGAESLDEWRTFRLDAAALARLTAE
jgi:GNAT superfamily N-acetyltransferase